MKFKITSGDSVFSFEGDLGDALSIMEKYWKPNSVITEARAATVTEDHKAKTEKKPQRKRKKATKITGAATAAKAAISIDAQELSNKIKSDIRFSAVKSKILDKKGDWLSKCKMVAYFAEEPITSGDVQRTMEAFKIKSALPSLSRALSSNTTEFLTQGENPVKYDLTAPSIEAFENWLSDNSDE